MSPPQFPRPTGHLEMTRKRTTSNIMLLYHSGTVDDCGRQDIFFVVRKNDIIGNYYVLVHNTPN